MIEIERQREEERRGRKEMKGEHSDKFFLMWETSVFPFYIPIMNQSNHLLQE
jgi:hypothetical protein